MKVFIVKMLFFIVRVFSVVESEVRFVNIIIFIIKVIRTVKYFF